MFSGVVTLQPERHTLSATSLLKTMARYEMTSFWAVWPASASYSRACDISFPAAGPDGVLHSRFIILGLNPGDSLVDRRPWHNFHTGPVHNDHFLAEAFRDTVQWGPYMTDLLTEVNSKSKTPDLSPETIRREVSVLADPIQALQAEDPLFILIGKKTAEAFARHERDLTDVLGLVTVRSVTASHYSASNSRVHRNNPATYRQLVANALGPHPLGHLFLGLRVDPPDGIRHGAVLTFAFFDSCHAIYYAGTHPAGVAHPSSHGWKRGYRTKRVYGRGLLPSQRAGNRG